MKIDGTDAVIMAQQVSNQADQSIQPVKVVQPEIKPVTKEIEDSGANYKVSEAFIRKAVDKANSTMKIQNRSVEFKVHEKTHDIIVKVIDSDTKEVIREIPSEKILDMFAAMLEQAGLLVDERR